MMDGRNETRLRNNLRGLCRGGRRQGCVGGRDGPLPLTDPLTDPVPHRLIEHLQRHIAGRNHHENNQGRLGDHVLTFRDRLKSAIDPAEDRIVQRIDRIGKLSAKPGDRPKPTGQLDTSDIFSWLKRLSAAQIALTTISRNSEYCGPLSGKTCGPPMALEAFMSGILMRPRNVASINSRYDSGAPVTVARNRM